MVTEKAIGKCHVFKYNSHYYIYNCLDGITAEITEEVYIALIYFLSNKRLEENQKDIISKLIEGGLLEISEINFDEPHCGNNIAYLSFAPVYECNFRCKYCFGEYGKKFTSEHRKFSEEDLEHVLKYFCNVAFPEADAYRIDFVSGGEPLLGLETIKQTILFAKRFYSSTNKNISIWLCTNGSLLSDEICEYLSSQSVSVGISLDGRREINDLNRIDAYGQSTYDIVTERMHHIMSNKKLSKKFRDLWCLSVATNKNNDFVDILRHHRNLGLNNVQIKLVRDDDEVEVGRILERYKELREFLLKEFLNEDFSYLYMILNENDQFGKILKRLMLNETVDRRCYAGTNKITICPDGTIYPCDSFVGLKEFELGNINSKILNNKNFENATIYNREKCNRCSLKYLCGGDCYYNSYINSGSILNPSKDFCKIQKGIIENCIVLCYEMNRENTQAYQNIIRRLKIKNGYIRIFG